VLVEGVRNKKAKIRYAAISAIGYSIPAPRIVLPILLSAFAKGDGRDREAVAVGFAFWQSSGFRIADAEWTPFLTRTQDYREVAASTIFALRMNPSIVQVIPKETLANEEFRHAYEEFHTEEPQWGSKSNKDGLMSLPSVDDIMEWSKTAHEAEATPQTGTEPGKEPSPQTATPPASTQETPESESPKGP
jgi:hypothetical protein